MCRFWRTPYQALRTCQPVPGGWGAVIPLPPSEPRTWDGASHDNTATRRPPSPNPISSSVSWEPGQSVLSAALFRHQAASRVPRCLPRAEEERTMPTDKTGCRVCSRRGDPDTFHPSCIGCLAQGESEKGGVFTHPVAWTLRAEHTPAVCPVVWAGPGPVFGT